MDVRLRWAALGALISIAGCSCGDEAACDPTQEDTGCDEGLVCERVQGEGAEPGCFPETSITGRVLDAQSGEPIVGARVVAIDANTGGAASNVVLSGEGGAYRVPLRLTRSTEAGADQKTNVYTLRVSAEGYQEFPSPVRQAIPLNVTRSEVEATATNTRDVGLLELEGVDPAALGSLSGRVQTGAVSVGGVLVVAEAQDGSARSAISDASGDYSILNLPAGTYAVRGYIAGLDFAPLLDVALAQGEERTGANLGASEAPALSTVRGSIQLVNPQTTTTETSLVLAVASTGEVPAGLSTMSVNKTYELTGVPPGRYDILASYNNDDLVLDPDPSQLPRPIRIELPQDASGGVLDVGSFKITGDVAIVSPGKDPLSQPPVPATGLILEWEDDSGEDVYGIEVFDAFGDRIWGSDASVLTTCPAVSAPKNTSQIAYAGPALEAGATYQWRVTSYTSTVTTCSPGTATTLVPISRSENLRGIFTVAM